MAAARGLMLSLVDRDTYLRDVWTVDEAGLARVLGSFLDGVEVEPPFGSPDLPGEGRPPPPAAFRLAGGRRARGRPKTGCGRLGEPAGQPGTE